MRIGLLNIMPEAEKYEELILTLLLRQAIDIEIVFIRAKDHAYKSSDKTHLEQYYITFEEAVEKQKLHGLILTGAPVETFTFENINYWTELLEIFEYAKHHIISTMGLCWGGIAIGKYLGIQSEQFNDKLFGVFPSTYLIPNHWLCHAANSHFHCPQSRYAGMNEAALIKAAKNSKIRLLANSKEAGHYIFESTDERFIAHLGHPEYNTKRIVAEYKRDVIKGLNHIPKHFDVINPVNIWQEHGNEFFSNWIQMINKKRNQY
jgi:homoserine O-succinyltransferase